MVESKGNTLDATTDALGRVTTITDDSGRTLSLTYSGTRLNDVVDPAGSVTLYGYDIGGRLGSVTDPDGFIVTYTYDLDNRVVAATDGNGNVDVSNVYDVHNRVSSRSNALGQTTTFTYDPANTRTTKRDPRGGNRVYEYDILGRIKSETDQVGNVTQFVYDAAGNHVQVLDADGNSVLTTYDAAGNPLQTTDQEGRVTTNTWINNLLASTTDPLGNTTVSAIDGLGRLTAATDPVGATTLFTYDSRGDVLTETDPLANTTSSSWDGVGSRTTVEDAAGNRATVTFASTDLLTGSVDRTGAASTFTYDSNGNRTAVQEPGAATTSCAFDAANQLTTTGTVTYTYSLLGQLTSIDDSITGNLGTFTYDPRGFTTGSTGPDGTTTYDVWGNLLTSAPPDVLGYAGGTTLDNGATRFGARIYIPELARFTSIDTARLSAGEAQRWTQFLNPTPGLQSFIRVIGDTAKPSYRGVAVSLATESAATYIECGELTGNDLERAATTSAAEGLGCVAGSLGAGAVAEQGYAVLADEGNNAVSELYAQCFPNCSNWEFAGSVATAAGRSVKRGVSNFFSLFGQ